jgi:hypothetical protein
MGELHVINNVWICLSNSGGPGSGHINSSSHHGGADLDCRGDDRDCRIGHGNNCAA